MISWRDLWRGFRWAGAGVLYAVKSQRNMRIHLLITAMVLPLGLFFGLSRVEWLFLLLAITLVLVAELLNTAVEVVVDLVSPGPHPLAGRAKDIAAGAVLLTALHAVAAGVLIFGPHLQQLFYIWGEAGQ